VSALGLVASCNLQPSTSNLATSNLLILSVQASAGLACLRCGTFISGACIAAYGFAPRRWVLFLLVGFESFAAITPPVVRSMFSSAFEPSVQGASPKQLR